MYRQQGHAYNDNRLYITNNIVRVLAERMNVAMARFLDHTTRVDPSLTLVGYNTVHLEQQQQSPVNTGRETG